MEPIWAPSAPLPRHPLGPLRLLAHDAARPFHGRRRWGLWPLAVLGLTPFIAGPVASRPTAPAQTAALAQSMGSGPPADPRPRAQRSDTSGPRGAATTGTTFDPSSPFGKDPPARLSEAIFAARLRKDDLDGLDDLCRIHAAAADNERLTRVRQRLLERPMQPVTLPKILATADVLLSCRAPAAALTVLDRFSPDRGSGRVQWLLLQWRAANANLDHRLAARALERLTGGQSGRLAALQLALTPPASGLDSSDTAPSPARRAAVDLLADHLEARGRPTLAAERLLAAARLPVAAGDTPARILQAERLHRAVSLLDGLAAAERERLLEPALEQAAAVGAWGMVLEMLDDQIRLESPRALERRLRLSARLDDAYGEWRLRQHDPGDGARLRGLEQRLRSPREPGGHAAEPAGASAPSGVQPAPATSPAHTAPTSSATPVTSPPSRPTLSPRHAMP